MRKICVFIGSRANYGSIRSVMVAIKKHPNLKLQLVVGAASLLDKYGEVVRLIKKDGFKPDQRIYMLVEGENPVTMAKSTGLGLNELATTFDKLAPDIVLVVGDRFEVLSAAIAAAFMNIPLAHTMGGEVSGTIDESIRHVITKLAHIHFPASERARRRILKLGENPKYVFKVGCPRIDEVKRIINKRRLADLSFEGVGEKIDVQKQFLFVSQYPVTTEFGCGERQINQTLKALKILQIPTIMLWPNPDAGSAEIAQGIRRFREKGKLDGLQIHFFKNLPIDVYFSLMKKTACMVGNSSSMVREGSFIGTPGVLIGTRETRRQRGKNVIEVDYNTDQIIKAVKTQLKHGFYKPEFIYGDGKSGPRIVRILAKVEVPIQKQLVY